MIFIISHYATMRESIRNFSNYSCLISKNIWICPFLWILIDWLIMITSMIVFVYGLNWIDPFLTQSYFVFLKAFRIFIFWYLIWFSVWFSLLLMLLGVPRQFAYEHKLWIETRCEIVLWMKLLLLTSYTSIPLSEWTHLMWTQFRSASDYLSSI